MTATHFAPRKAGYKIRVFCGTVICSLLAGSLLAGGARPVFADEPKTGTVAPLQDADYLVGVDDVLTIVAPGHDELTQQVIVLPDGQISVAGIAEPIKADGKTLRQLKADIFKGLDKLYNNLQLTVGLKETNSRTVTMVGGRTGGRFRLSKGMRISGLLGLSGGLPSKTKYVKGTLIRDGEVIKLNMPKIIGQEPDPAADIALKPLDTIIIDFVEEAPPPTYSVAGAVQKGGSFPMPLDGSPISLGRAVSDAGGRTERAALTKVVLVRNNNEKIELNMYPLLVEGKVDNREASMKMQDGDLLIIPELDAKYFVSGQVNRPTTMFLPEARTVTVTQALSDGGGPTQNADLRKAGIMRTVNGEKILIPVNIDDLLRKPDSKMKKDKNGKMLVQNYIMQDGDVLYIPPKGKGFSLQDLTSPLWALSMLGFRLQ